MNRINNAYNTRQLPQKTVESLVFVPVIPGVIEKSEFEQGGSSDFSAGTRDIARGKAAESREGPGDLRSAEQMSAANRLESEDGKYEAKPTPHQNRFFNHERYIPVPCERPVFGGVSFAAHFPFSLGPLSMTKAARSKRKIGAASLPNSGSFNWNGYRWAEVAVTTGLIFLHECGHALAATLLYQNANPKIDFSYFGGQCTYNSANLSALGKKVGASNADSLVASAGPIIDIVAMLGITKLTRSDRHAAQLMKLKAIGLSVYAFSALFFCYPSHDFCSVWSKSGILAYGVLTAGCLATTALVLRNATKPLNDERANRNFYGNRGVRPLSF